jgi:hypothetical protein
MSRVYNNDLVNDFESCVFHRFKELEDLRIYFDNKFSKYGVVCKDISRKCYYDMSDNSDYEIMITLGNSEEDLYDVTVYYAITRKEERIIVEMGYEEV